ncbi:hypothetical protein EDB89DRAFT_1910807 [Lactarius sanguifluus]|nr:hypothetical protein EDB89DRAFT_1910807 [Lactarius sanguifluus]
MPFHHTAPPLISHATTCNTASATTPLHDPVLTTPARRRHLHLCHLTTTLTAARKHHPPHTGHALALRYTRPCDRRSSFAVTSKPTAPTPATSPPLKTPAVSTRPSYAHRRRYAAAASTRLPPPPPPSNSAACPVLTTMTPSAALLQLTTTSAATTPPLLPTRPRYHHRSAQLGRRRNHSAPPQHNVVPSSPRLRHHPPGTSTGSPTSTGTQRRHATNPVAALTPHAHTAVLWHPTSCTTIL